ncbi:SIS domain-containing protein [Xylariaceae sp. FL0804]|nr:SIS domain-containing protein [Xylariaceae sp. FL0804]
MVEPHPVHNSEVYLLGLAPRRSVPPPSPPSPLTPSIPVETGSSIQHLCLDDGEGLEEAPATGWLAAQRTSGAIHVLHTEAAALQSLTNLYKTNAIAAEGFSAAVEVVVRRSQNRGKLVVVGIGKSGHIAKKLVATFNSLGLPATFLHPTEALHGDLGKIGKHDAVLFITFSGKTPELLALLPHVDGALPAIVLTASVQPSDCELIRQRPGAILLPAPVHEPETVSFGVSAPTTSTTAALALGDALAIVAAQELHASVSSVFSRNHPGGAIGASFRRPQTVRDLAIALKEIPASPAAGPKACCGGDVLKLGYDSASGWVRVGESAVASPGRIRNLDAPSLAKSVADLPGLVAERSEWIVISADTRIPQAASWIRNSLISSDPEETPCGELSIVAVSDDHGKVVAVLEAGQLLR